MDRHSAGFSLIETSCLLSLTALTLFWAWPSYRQWMDNQYCKQFVVELDNQLRWTALQAIILQQDILIDTSTFPYSIVIQQSQQQLKTIFAQHQITYRWYSQHPLLFHANPLKNHVNGYFLVNCVHASPLKLWVNRLGHTREER